MQCEICQQACTALALVADRNTICQSDFVLVCASCAEMQEEEHFDDPWRCPVDYGAVNYERRMLRLAAWKLKAVALTV